MVDSVDCRAVLADARASGSIADLKAAVELCKVHHFSGPEYQKAKTECTRLEAREQLFNAQQGESYRLIQKRLKRAQHWLSKQEVQAAQDIVKRLCSTGIMLHWDIMFQRPSWISCQTSVQVSANQLRRPQDAPKTVPKT